MQNRESDIAFTYHEETKHSYDSVYRSHHFLDWDNQPRPYKVYVGLEPIALPQPLPETNTPALLALAPPEVSSQARTPLRRVDLAYLLWYAAGVTRRRQYPGHGDVLFRAAACTGALYHIELYAAVAGMPDLQPGLYHFSPVDFALRKLRDGDYRRLLVEASGDDPALQQAPAILIGADTFWRNSWKYRARAYRHSFWDAGTILANLLAAAAAHQVPAQVALGFVDSSVNALLDLDPDREAATFLVGLGTGAPVAAAAPLVTPLHLEVEPLSGQEVDYPAIRLTHAASCLERPEEVADWRESAPLLTLPATSGPVIALRPAQDEDLPADSIEAVIRRRGSSRQFTHEPLTLTQLSNVLVRATQDFPVDVLQGPDVRLNDIYLIVHAVTDVPAGAYVLHGRDQRLELLRAGQFRHEAGMLALGQELAADASVDVFLLCDLRQVLELLGNRGYRAAQLEAGLLGGRMYLAAYAQGLGASGLTFFDDEVTEFFSPHAAGKSVMFLVALGHSGRRRRL